MSNEPSESGEMYPHGAHMKPSGEIIHAYDGGGFSYDTAGRVAGGAPFFLRANILIRGCPTLSRSVRKGGPG